jgi:hypothetical protein
MNHDSILSGHTNKRFDPKTTSYLGGYVTFKAYRCGGDKDLDRQIKGHITLRSHVGRENTKRY